MAYQTWQVERIAFCPHVGREVALEVLLVYPAEHLPDQPPQIRARRCSLACLCNLLEHPTCIWSGTNPTHDPL